MGPVAMAVGSDLTAAAGGPTSLLSERPLSTAVPVSLVVRWPAAGRCRASSAVDRVSPRPPLDPPSPAAGRARSPRRQEGVFPENTICGCAAAARGRLDHRLRQCDCLLMLGRRRDEVETARDLRHEPVD
jgi:hypothetical protein